MFSSPETSRNNTREKISYFFTCIDIANQLLTHHSSLAPLDQVEEWTAKSLRFSIQAVTKSTSRHLTRSLRSLVSYRGKHSKGNSISTHTYVLFSMCLIWYLNFLFNLYISHVDTTLIYDYWLYLFHEEGILKKQTKLYSQIFFWRKMLISAERAYMQNTFIALTFPLINF